MIQAKIAVVCSILLLLCGSLLTRKVSAEEIVVSGNGADSTNEVQQTTSSDTNIQSTNTTNVDNNVQVTTNTGDNTASDNTNGSTDVKTGDTKVSTDITNSGNTSAISTQQNCCSQQGSMTIISGNGAGSQNSVTNQTNNSTNITVNQTANITNNVTVNANTGGNTTNGNSGNTTIETGNITVRQSIKNAPVNLTWINAAIGTTKQDKLAITGNGTDSVNQINFLNNTNTNIAVNNVANIFNNSLLNLNTGDNEASDNLGNVKLTTGDIIATVDITNAVNAAKVDVSCGCKEKQPEQPAAPVTPVQKVTPPANETSSSGSTSTGEVAGIAMGQVLPATGANWLFLAFISNVMMLFLGMILRLRSGNAPGAVAVA